MGGLLNCAIMQPEPKKYGGALLPEPQTRPCEYCKQDFLIHRTAQLKTRFCGRSCSAKWRMRQPEHLAKVHTPEVAAKRGKSRLKWLRSPAGASEIERIRNLNPMSNPETRAKVSATLKAIGHKPSVRGGNGKGMTEPQKLMKAALLGDWMPEFAISLGKLTDGYPTCYKVDLADVGMKIAIELDGFSHHSRKGQDVKKDQKLSELGWTVLRFWNKEVTNWIESGKNEEHNVSITLKTNGIKF